MWCTSRPMQMIGTFSARCRHLPRKWFPHLALKLLFHLPLKSFRNLPSLWILHLVRKQFLHLPCTLLLHLLLLLHLPLKLVFHLSRKLAHRMWKSSLIQLEFCRYLHVRSPLQFRSLPLLLCRRSPLLQSLLLLQHSLVLNPRRRPTLAAIQKKKSIITIMITFIINAIKV